MSRQLESLLRQTGLLSDAQLARSLEQARKQGVSLLEVVLKDEHVSEDQVADGFATRLKLSRVRVAATVSDPEALKKVPDKIARKYWCLPLSIEGRVLTLAMADPGDYQAIQDVEFASALSIRPVVATRTEIADGIDERYDAEDRIGAFLANVPEVTDLHIVAEENAQDLVVEVADSRSAAEVAPVVKMCNLIIHDSIKAGASDMHIEPTVHDVQVRQRVDGVLRDYTHVPKWLHSPLISRLKILARLDIAERRLPQDGRINVQYQGRSIDIRVSTLPTHFGEKAVLRFLGGGTLPRIDRMGLNETQSAILEGAIRQPQGMILVTGPTGSGKTTTLYALLAKRKSPEVNIVTVEDPIEYQLPGINQVQINPKAGLSFAGVLRSILRQDPDVILVGETRDQETAEVGFQAAMTGHLVLSTLHTNSAVAAVPRLYDLDVDPSILANSLTLVIAQRLVRRICEQCKEPYAPDPATAMKVGLAPTDGPVYLGKGCPACGGTGFNGRVGIYEFFRPTNQVRKLITSKASESDLRAAARQGGMKSLREDALDKVRAGITSPEEVLRVVQIDEAEAPCPQCGALIESDFSTCPYCLSSLKKSCAGCGQELKLEWKACPYCNASAVPIGGSEAGEHGATAGPPAAPHVIVVQAPAPAPIAPPPQVTPPPGVPLPSAPPNAPRFIPPVAEPVREVLDDLVLTRYTEDPRVKPTVPVLSSITPPVPAPPIPAPASGPGHQEWPGVRVFDFDSVPTPTPDQMAAVSQGIGVDVGSVERAQLRGEREKTGTKASELAEAMSPGRAAPPIESVAAAKPTAIEPATIEPPPEPIPTAVVTAAPAPAHAAPLVIAQHAKPERPAVAALAPPSESVAAEALGRRLRIMVVDDDEDIRQVVAFTLKKLPVPVDIVQAVDGQDGVEKAESQPPDLVILDVMMPRLNGFETCDKLRQSVRTAFVPILMLTASADEISRSQGYMVGTDDYMGKPFQPIELRLRVTRLLRRTYGI